MLSALLDWLLSWSRNFGEFCSGLKQIFALRNPGNDVLKLSAITPDRPTESTISTSLVHSSTIRIWDGVRNLSKCTSEIWSLYCSNHIFFRIPSAWDGGFQVNDFLRISRWFSVIIHFLTSCLKFSCSWKHGAIKFWIRISSMQHSTIIRCCRMNLCRWISKNIPDVPRKYRVSGCWQQSRLSMPQGIWIITGWLGTWDNLELQADSTSWNSLGSFI